jgi:hypothetical protein
LAGHFHPKGNQDSLWMCLSRRETTTLDQSRREAETMPLRRVSS